MADAVQDVFKEDASTKAEQDEDERAAKKQHLEDVRERRQGNNE